jgi:hypothetical protein
MVMIDDEVITAGEVDTAYRTRLALALRDGG